MAENLNLSWIMIQYFIASQPCLCPMAQCPPILLYKGLTLYLPFLTEVDFSDRQAQCAILSLFQLHFFSTKNFYIVLSIVQKSSLHERGEKFSIFSYRLKQLTVYYISNI